MINSIQLYNIAPAIPEPIQFLEVLSRNLWWSWNAEAIDIFQRMDATLWKTCRHNPLEFLSRIPHDQLTYLAADESFIKHLERVKRQFEDDVSLSRSAKETAARPQPVAYFSLEYGIHESVRLYAGGLGCLAGDHLKAASDMGLHLVAIGLMYRQGYFQQYLNDDGWQQETYLENPVDRLPLRKACDAAGKPIQVSLPIPGGRLCAEVWRLDVGRVPLFLLDTNIAENSAEYRAITARLYEGDRLMRLRQELLLGIGGVRALSLLGYDPPTFHMNEGHAAFCSLARLAQLTRERGLDLETAVEVVSRTTVFTTHTPVPAGNEMFSVDLLRPHFEALREELGLSPDQILAWGKPTSHHEQHELSMTILALRMSSFVNGVSRLHGQVARAMWGHLWPERPVDEVPIGHITNGVHVSSWISTELNQVFDKYLGPDWREHPADPHTAARISEIPDDLLWRAHQAGRSRLIRWTRERAEAQYQSRSARRTEILRMKSVLNHDMLTIGFARRFASYKRAALLLNDPDRFEAILTSKSQPVQILFAGKAHPADNPGKEIIQRIVQFARQAGVRDRVIFLENYDIMMARHLVQGVDIWLNNPRRPLEASGTSGMKAAVNGGLHVSTLDGWWDEAYTPASGWAIGNGEEHDNADAGDQIEAHALYNLLENTIIPCFYDRPDGDIPTQWIAMMKASIAMGLNFFTSHRMVGEYDNAFYKPAIEAHAQLTASQCRAASDLVKQRHRLEQLWPKIRVAVPTADRDISLLHMGDTFEVTTRVHLGGLHADEVDVEVYHGPVNSENHIIESFSKKMELKETLADGVSVYRQSIACKAAGRYGCTTRVAPAGKTWNHLIPGFLTWAQP